MQNINVLSLFDGISGGQLALQKIGITINRYYASEINQYSIGITQKNFPNTIQLGDVTQINQDKIDSLEKIDLMIFGSPCFVKGTLIMTNKGYKEIENIQAGDMVLTHTNTFRKVITPMINQCNEVYRINCMSSEDLLVTQEHPFYARKKYRYHPTINGKRVNQRKFEEPKWVAAKDLTKDHYLGIAINQNKIIPKTNIDSIDEKIGTESFWWIVGRYIGDGWSNFYKRKNRKNAYVHRVVICCNKNEVNEIKEKLDGIYHYNLLEERTVYKFHINDKDLFSYLQQFGKYARGKFLTNDIFDLPANLLKSFIDGYISADGCYTQNKYSISTSSKYLAYGIGHCIAKAYKRPYAIYKAECPKTCVIEGRTVNQRDKYIVKFQPDKRKQDKAFYENGYVWIPINSIKKEKYQGHVYNMEVEEDNSYTANNIIVHNCENLSITVINNEQHNQGLDGEKSKLFREAVRIKNLVRPRFWMMENVASMSDKNRDIITKILGVEPIMINSNIFSAQDRERYYWTNIPLNPLPASKELVLKDIMEPYVDKKYWYDKSFTFNGWDKKVIATLDINCHDIGKRVYNPNMTCATLTAVQGGYQEKKVYDNGRCRKLTPIEYERLQTVPDNFTEGVADSKRYSMLGDGWTIDVITYIFEQLKYII